MSVSASVFQIGLNAMTNVSQRPIDEGELRAILASGDGPGHLVRALFGDCSFETIDRMARAAGLSRDAVQAAYLVAKARHGAANADIDEAT